MITLSDAASALFGSVETWNSETRRSPAGVVYRTKNRPFVVYSGWKASPRSPRSPQHDMRAEMSRKIPPPLPPLTITTWPVCWITNSRASPGALETPMALANPEATGLRPIETTASGVGKAVAAGVALVIGVALAAGAVASAVAVSVAGGTTDTKPPSDAVAVLVPHAATTAMTRAEAMAAKVAEGRLPRPSEFRIRCIPLPSSDSGN